ncbi:uncharacterized protein LOC134856953 [Symsagittifera roscoffensis]|uniref:uncharacterized protein LOC134856953 n=1 Tax=Symsagittifera roscoffensis TaxID=84072 RepID=UPI00307BA7E4
MTSTVGANKRKLTIAEDLQGAMKESNADGKDHFFQPHLKSQVTQKLINQQSEDAMQQVCQQTLSRLKSGASEFYKCLEKEEKSPKKEQAAELKPTKRELLKPSIVFDVNSNETQTGDFRCCNSDSNAVQCYYCTVLICTSGNDNPCGAQCKLCKQFFCHKCRCENLCLGCS